MIEGSTEASESTEGGLQTQNAGPVQVPEMVMFESDIEACLGVSLADKGKNGMPCKRTEVLETVLFLRASICWCVCRCDGR